MPEIIDNQFVRQKDGFFITKEIIGLDFTAGTGGSLPNINDQLYYIFIAKFPCEIMQISIINSSGTGGLKMQNTGNEVVTAIDLSDVSIKTLKGSKLFNTVMKENDYLRLTSTGSLLKSQKIHLTIYFKYLKRGNYRV